MDRFIATTDFSIKGKEIYTGTILTTDNCGLTSVDFALLLRIGRVTEMEETTDYYDTVDNFTIGTRTAIAQNEAFVLPEPQPDIENKVKMKRTRRKKSDPISVISENPVVEEVPVVKENISEKLPELSETNEKPEELEEVVESTEKAEDTEKKTETSTDVIVPKKRGRKKNKDQKSE